MRSVWRMAGRMQTEACEQPEYNPLSVWCCFLCYYSLLPGYQCLWERPQDSGCSNDRVKAEASDARTADLADRAEVLDVFNS